MNNHKVKTIYQTLEDRNTDLDVLENNGPYLCNWENSWLGGGYYFWDTFIENAHWWGKEIRSYPNGYIICQAICDFNTDKCFDLVGDMEHLADLKKAYDLMVHKGIANKRTTVKRIISFLKDDLKIFNYEAIRVHGIKSRSYNSRFNFTLNFEKNRVSYLDVTPTVQICFFNKKSLGLRDYKIVFPDEYIDGFVV